MQYYSTNHQTTPTSFKEAVIRGLAPDRGLFMPESIPNLSADFFRRLPELSLAQIGFEVARPFIQPEIADQVLKDIVDEVFTFDIPLVELRKDLHILELFHGPTCAFKDVGARFMSRIMGHFLKGEERKVYVLVATSGDTGSAVAQGFYRVPNVNVVILYPSGKVSPVQEMQFCTLGENITALEVDGTFDDCQRLVKQAFANPELREILYLTSANSINIARLLPQSFYYFYGYAQLRRKYAEPVVFSVPSGNYGNLTAGLLAQQMGLPVQRFIAASNANDTVPLYLQNGSFLPKPSVSTISNAMDVGDPSNFARMLELFSSSVNHMREGISGFSLSDDETMTAMREIYQQFDYQIDPHGAVGYKALQRYKDQSNKPFCGIVLGTAHPAKFSEVVSVALGKQPPLPPQLAACLNQPKVSLPMSSDFNEFKVFLEERAKK